jgi:phosphoribosylamine-glycine ligase
MKLSPSYFQGHNIWILKATGFNRGRGIHVFNKLEELNRLIKEYTEGASNPDN